jgi:hypothetical protein
LFKLALLEAYEVGVAAVGVLVVDLDQAGDEELLFFVRLGLPVVRLAERHDKAHVSGPLLVVRGGRRAGERLDAGQVIEKPRLSDGEGAIGVLLGLVDAHTAGLAHGDDDDAGFLVLGCSRRGRRR